MDTSIRRIEAGPAPTYLGRGARSVPAGTRVGAVQTPALAVPQASTTSLRKAILDCAHQATIAEPNDTDRRLHSFIAKLSGTMEGLGERELDAVLWNLMATTDAHQVPA